MMPVVRILLVANIAAFLLQGAFPAVEFWGVFVPQRILVMPWTLITYMFLHGSFTHILFNMLGLYFFGSQVEDRMGSRRFLIMYFLSGISGALLSMVLSPNAALVGASAGVFGVMLAFARYWPDQPIHIWGIIPVPARVLVIITTIVAIWSGIGSTRGARGDNIAHFAHLGGYAGAYLYIRWLERGRHEWKKKVVAVPPTATKRIEDWRKIDLSHVHSVNRDEVKRLIEKIAADGIGALTPQERLFLSNFVPLGGQPGAPPS
jgi:membrane associated rhomboid family serine protease